jgi:hypothetical protein
VVRVAIVVRDLVGDFLAVTRDATPAERPARWRAYVDRHRDVFDVYAQHAALPGTGHLDEPLERLFAARSRLATRAASAGAAAREAVTTATRLLGHPEIDAEIVLMVGLYRSNGWVSGGTLYVGVEQYPEDPRYGRLLLVHEAAHLVHEVAHLVHAPEQDVAGSLLGEGLATLVSALASPGLTDAECLWFAPGHDDWLASCRARHHEIAARIRADLEATDLDTYAIYFLLRDSPLRGDLPLRCGYYLGLLLARRLASAYGLEQVARWPHARIVAELRRALS